jgi:hypothetical protein
MLVDAALALHGLVPLQMPDEHVDNSGRDHHEGRDAYGDADYRAHGKAVVAMVIVLAGPDQRSSHHSSPHPAGKTKRRATVIVE